MHRRVAEGPLPTAGKSVIAGPCAPLYNRQSQRWLLGDDLKDLPFIPGVTQVAFDSAGCGNFVLEFHLAEIPQIRGVCVEVVKSLGFFSLNSSDPALTFKDYYA